MNINEETLFAVFIIAAAVAACFGIEGCVVHRNKELEIEARNIEAFTKAGYSQKQIEGTGQIIWVKEPQSNTNTP